MAHAHVRHVATEECIELCFTLLNKMRCLSRPRNEPLERTVRRIKLFYDQQHQPQQPLSKRELRRRAKHLSNSKQEQHTDLASTTKVTFFNRSKEPIDLQMPLSQALEEAVAFTVNDCRYDLYLNQPRVLN